MKRPNILERAARISRAAGIVASFAAIAVSGCSDEKSPASSPAPAPRTAAAVPEPQPPNVLVITLDTTRADALSSYGQKRPTTPHLDLLAARGARFLTCSTSAPSTLPSHSSIFTGKHPYAHGARANSGHVLSKANQTLAEVLKAHGYATGAEVAAPVIGSYTQLDQGFDIYRDTAFADITKKTVTYANNPTKPTELPERDAIDITRHAIRFVQENRNRKFFLWAHYFDAHQPYSPPIEHFERVGKSDYYGEIHFADEQIDRLLREVDALGLTERTLIVVTADHGEGRGEHAEDTHVFFVYDSTMRVPLLMAGPGVPPGLVIEAPVRTIDIAPTILDLLGLPPFEAAQGQSLRPLLTGETPDLDVVAYGESIDAHLVFGTPIVRFIRQGRWKYIHKVHPELYDLVADPAELDDRAAREPEVVAQMQARLRELIANAPAPPTDSQEPVDAAAAAQLEALGYIVSAGGEELADELSLLELDGDDVNEKVDDIKRIASGMGMMKAKNFEGAVEQLRPVVEHNPDRTPTILKLAAALKGLGEIEERRSLLERVIELAPDMIDPYVSLAELHFQQGDQPGAERLLEAALGLDPCDSSTRATLAHLADLRKDHRRHVEMLRGGVDACDPSDEYLNNYAYALATTPIDEDRDGAEALRIAKQITSTAKGQRPDFIDTLAAAYAETGDFANASAAAKQALALLESAGAPPEAREEARQHLALFESGNPVRVQ